MSARQVLLNVLGGSCTLCNLTEKLHLHHKDRNRENNDLSNIQLLCESCHLKIHSNDRWEHRNQAILETYGQEAIGVSKLSSKYQVTIPKDARLQFNLEPGDRILFTEEEGNLILKKG